MRRILTTIISIICVLLTYAQDNDSLKIADLETEAYTKPCKKDNGFGIKICFGFPNKHFGNLLADKNEYGVTYSSIDFKYKLTCGFAFENRFYLCGNQNVRFGINARWFDFDFTKINTTLNDEDHYNANVKKLNFNIQSSFSRYSPYNRYESKDIFRLSIQHFLQHSKIQTLYRLQVYPRIL